MTKKKWDEEKLNKTLRSMPTIEDRRSKEEILERLHNDSRLAEKQPEQRASKVKWMPIIAAVAAVLLLTILVPTFLNPNEHQTAMDRAVPKSESDSTAIQNRAVQESTESADTAMVEVNSTTHYAAYETTGQLPFHLGLATDQATIVPITFLVPKEQVLQDFQTAKPSAVELYNKYANEIDEESLGFEEYHPYDANISSKNNRVVMKFRDDHSYDLSSATLEMLNLSIQSTFYGMDEVEFLSEDGSPIELDQVGIVTEPISLYSATSHQAYFRFINNDTESFLSSSFGQSFDTIEEALHAMKRKPNDLYSSVVPEAVDFSVTVDQDVVRVKFTELLDLESMSTDDAMQLIEGIILTAASFDSQVLLDNIVQKQWNDFDFTQPLQKPIGPNPIQFTNN